MQPSKPHAEFLTWLLPFIPGITILLIQFGWKLFYLSGHVPGIYWLFVIVDRYYFESLVAAFLGSGLFLLLMLLQKSAPKRRLYFSRISLSLFIMGIAIVCTFPMTFAQNSIHLESIRAGGRIYNLTAYPLFDTNFSVAECDPLGIFCTTIYRSYDIITVQKWQESHLVYNAQDNLLLLEISEEGTIFSYEVP